MEKIIAFCNFDETKIPIFEHDKEEYKIILCGGLNFFHVDNSNSFQFLKNEKEKRGKRFVILLSPNDILFLTSILDMFKFIVFSNEILGDVSEQVDDVDPPKNILNFMQEYKNIIDKDIMKKIIQGEDVKINEQDRLQLYSIIKTLEKYNIYNMSTAIYILKNSNIVMENSRFIFSSENGYLGYEGLENYKKKYKNSIEEYISFNKSKFLKRYSSKHKKISLPKLNKTYILGDNDKKLDRPYFRSDQNVVYIGTTKTNYYLERSNLNYYNNPNAFSYVEIDDDNITVKCLDCKNNYSEYNLDINTNNENTYEIEPRKYLDDLISTKNYAIVVSDMYCAIPIKTEKTFIVSLKKNVKRLKILPLTSQNLENAKTIRSILKISDLLQEDESKSVRSGRTQKLSEILREDNSSRSSRRSFNSGKTRDLKDIIDENSVSSKKSVTFNRKTKCRSDSSDSSDLEEFCQQIKG